MMEVENINGVPTHVVSLAANSENPTGKMSKNNSLLLIVPGSPGMGHFYIPFATKLFDLGKGSYDVSVVSHAGHSPGHAKATNTESEVEMQAPAGDWYSLEDQIAHKMAFLEKHEDKDSIYLVGHSIGCWIVLQMLCQLEPSRVKKVVLLFPTVEKMSVTPNGQKMASLFTTCRSPFTAMVWLISFIPSWFKQYVLQWYFHTTPQDHREHIIQGAININSKCIHNVLCMADQEMKEVVEPPLEVIDNNIDKLVFYYGTNDEWTVASCYEDMKCRHPDKDINQCKNNFPHAFIESASDDIAQFVFSRLPHKIIN